MLLNLLLPVGSGKTFIGSNQSDALSQHTGLEFLQQEPGSRPLAGVGGDDHAFKEIALSIAGRKALASLYFFVTIIATRPPFSVVLTLWLSITATVGKAFRSCATRTCFCNAASTMSQTPLCCQRQKHE